MKAIANFDKLPFSFKQEIEQSGGGDTIGGWIIPPLFDGVGNRLTRLLYTISPVGAGVGRVETTTELEDEIKSNSPNIIAVSWPQGNVNIITQDDSVPVTAFRLAVQSGKMRLTVRGI